MSEKRIGWIIHLQGHVFDLEDFAHWTKGNEIRVLQLQGGRFALFFPVELFGTNHTIVGTKAQEVLEVLNGLGALESAEFEGIKISGDIYTIDENWQPRDAVIQITGIAARSKVGRPTVTTDGPPTQDPTIGMAHKVMHIAGASDALRDALTLVGRYRPTWSELYVAYELVKSNANGLTGTKGWISTSDETRFKRTANSRTALGIDARHGKETEQPPANPMDHDEAVVLIRKLVRLWVRWAAAQA